MEEKENNAQKEESNPQDQKGEKEKGNEVQENPNVN